MWIHEFLVTQQLLPLHRLSCLSPEVIAEKKISGKIARPGSSYYQFSFGFGKEWQIDLRYMYKGLYVGRAKYPDYWGNKTKMSEVNINIHLSSDLSTGSGTYSYSNVSDFGRYVSRDPHFSHIPAGRVN